MSMTLQDAMLNAALNRASHRLTQPTVQARLAEAESRLFDILLGDDGQAYKEAERYLARHRPDLMARLDAQG